MKKLLTLCFFWTCIISPIATGVVQCPMQQPSLDAGGDMAPCSACDTAEQRTHSVMGGRADREVENTNSSVFAGSLDMPLPPAPPSTTSRIAAATPSLCTTSTPSEGKHYTGGKSIIIVKKDFSQNIHSCLDFCIQTFLPKSPLFFDFLSLPLAQVSHKARGCMEIISRDHVSREWPFLPSYFLYIVTLRECLI